MTLLADVLPAVRRRSTEIIDLAVRVLALVEHAR